MVFNIINYGLSITELTVAIRQPLLDLLQNELEEDENFKGVDVATFPIMQVYNLEAFFTTYDSLSIKGLVKLSGPKAGLLRQYAKGVRGAS